MTITKTHWAQSKQLPFVLEGPWQIFALELPCYAVFPPCPPGVGAWGNDCIAVCSYAAEPCYMNAIQGLTTLLPCKTPPTLLGLPATTLGLTCPIPTADALLWATLVALAMFANKLACIEFCCITDCWRLRWTMFVVNCWGIPMNGLYTIKGAVGFGTGSWPTQMG